MVTTVGVDEGQGRNKLYGPPENDHANRKFSSFIRYLTEVTLVIARLVDLPVGHSYNYHLEEHAPYRKQVQESFSLSACCRRGAVHRLVPGWLDWNRTSRGCFECLSYQPTLSLSPVVSVWPCVMVWPHSPRPTNRERRSLRHVWNDVCPPQPSVGRFGSRD
jgi:hypothetical protein